MLIWLMYDLLEVYRKYAKLLLWDIFIEVFFISKYSHGLSVESSNGYIPIANWFE